MLAAYIASLFEAALTWKHIKWLARVTKLPVLVKGVAVTTAPLDHPAARDQRPPARREPDLLEYVDWDDAFLEEPLQIQDGLARVPDRPGIGLDVEIGSREGAVAGPLIRNLASAVPRCPFSRSPGSDSVR